MVTIRTTVKGAALLLAVPLVVLFAWAGGPLACFAVAFIVWRVYNRPI